jgi:hypothetical protein
MVDGNRNGNGRWQRQRQWAIAPATATATAMELATAMEMAMAMAMATATARATITKEGLSLHVAAMCSAFGGATPCLHPHGHKEKCMHHGGDIAKSVCSPSRGRVPDSSPWIVFVYFLQLLFSLLNNPLFTPPHYSGAQEPCQPIDALPPPLLQEPHQPIDNLPQLLLHFLSR